MIDVLVADDDFHVAKIHAAYVERLTGFTVVGRAHTAAATLSAVEPEAEEGFEVELARPGPGERVAGRIRKK